jgi:hypothetical protein
MATHLNLSETVISATHRMLGIGVAGEIVDTRTAPSDGARATLREKISNRWHDPCGNEKS